MTKQEYQELISDEQTLLEIKEKIESCNYKGSQHYPYYGVETGVVGSAHQNNWVQKEIVSFGATDPNLQAIKQTIYEHYCNTDNF